MGTRSMILRPVGDVWEGRYCHWDGYPTHLGYELLQIVQRDGLEAATKVLIDDHGRWSGLNSEVLTGEVVGSVVKRLRYGDKYENQIAGYGAFWPDGNLMTYDDHLCDAEWAYLLAADGLWVAKCDYNSEPTWIGKVKWNANMEEARLLLTLMEESEYGKESE